MKKSFLILAAAAGMFAACTNEDAVLDQQVAQQDPNGVYFGVYVDRATRAGAPQSITTTSLQSGDHATAGFGVFGYYTDNNEYTQYALPNFMYNEQVKYNAGQWEYEPVKYWPNEFGPGAASDETDKLSFFAYAPYVEVTPTDGKPVATTEHDKVYNITQLTKNTTTGDPIIKYVVDPNPATSVDLLWGVAPASSAYTPVEGASGVVEGMPYKDLVKAQTASRVDFNFKHALASLNVSIDAIVDEIQHGTTPVLDASKTRIYIRSISLSGLALKGALNLNNETANTPLWLEYDGSKTLTTGSALVVNDGRKDGKEATENGEQKSEQPSTLNVNLVQSYPTYKAGVKAGAFHDEAKPGVTETPVNLFQGTDANAPIFVIPTGEEMNVTIVYDVETIDPNLPTYLADGVTHGSSIENRITQDNVFVGNIEAGKSYTLKLHLGMTSVKFDATVSDWNVQPAKDVDLPANTRSVYISPDNSVIGAGSTDVTLTATDGTGDPYSLSSATIVQTLTQNAPAAATDKFKVVGDNIEATLENLMVYDALYTVTVTVGVPCNVVTVLQKAHALGLSFSATDGLKDLTLTSTGEVPDWTAETFTITKNGEAIAAADYTVTSTNTKAAKITLPAAVEAGDVITITVKAGDANPETVTYTVPEPVPAP